MSFQRIVILLLIVLLLAGCQSLNLPDFLPMGKNASPNPQPTLEPFLQEAVKDLAKRSGVRANEITVTGVVDQDFTEAAFRCEGTKEQIANDPSEATISGQIILLEAGGRQYVYHSGNGEVFFCRAAD